MRMTALALLLLVSIPALAQTPPVEKRDHGPKRCEGFGAEHLPVSWQPRADGLCYPADNPYVKYGHH